MDRVLFEVERVLAAHGYRKEHDDDAKRLIMFDDWDTIDVLFDEVNDTYQVKATFDQVKGTFDQVKGTSGNYVTTRFVDPYRMTMKTVAHIMASISDAKTEFLDYYSDHEEV